jgi:alpha-N-arabinofuranosidase
MSPRPTYRNPILSGFYPDPSICRVGEDFYLVNSSFAYFPGLPVHHSRDLVRWEQIGNALDRPSQLPLEGAGVSRGLFAPTIRHYRGLFYIICTNVDHGGNFIVTAKDPAGPWSEPAWLPEAPGIDPSLFFDEDAATHEARAWYCGTRPASEGERYLGNWEVWLQELDLGTLTLKGEAQGLWRGALRDCVWPEGPHIYRKDGWYYLMIAEGGTGPDHAITVARSREVGGPYVGKPSNPILTHRHLGRSYPVVNVGHGDLVEDPAGDWWIVHLASRPVSGASPLGRETFLVPVAWEDEWPLPSPGVGLVLEEFPAPRLPFAAVTAQPDRDDFSEPTLDARWLSLRGPASDFSSLQARPGYLRLEGRATTLREKGRVAFLCRRQVAHNYRARTAVEFMPGSGASAGLALFQSEDYQYRLELSESEGSLIIRLVRAAGRANEVLAQRSLGSAGATGLKLILEAEARGLELAFRFGASEDSLETLAEGVDASILSPERAGGFVGTVIGVFATAIAGSAPCVADFDYFELSAL